MLEAYTAYTDFNDVMNLTEGIIRNAAEKVLGTAKITYDGQAVDLESDFKRIHMVDAIKEQTGVDFWQEMTLEEIGDKFGLTRERVRQIKEKAIRRLRQNSRSKLLKSYLG